MIKLSINILLIIILTTFVYYGCSQHTRLQTDTSQSTAKNTDDKLFQSSPQEPSPVILIPTKQSIDTKNSADSLTEVTIKCENKELHRILRWLQKNDADIPIGNTDWDCSDFIKIRQHFDLNGDGIKEIFVTGSGAWGAVSTLPIWVMQKKKNGYRVLLKEQGEFYTIKKTSTNGYRDLYFPSRRDIMSTFLSTYKFRKDKYYKAKCQVEFYYDPDKIRKVFDCNDEKGIDGFRIEPSK